MVDEAVSRAFCQLSLVQCTVKAYAAMMRSSVPGSIVDTLRLGFQNSSSRRLPKSLYRDATSGT